MFSRIKVFQGLFFGSFLLLLCTEVFSQDTYHDFLADPSQQETIVNLGGVRFLVTKTGEFVTNIRPEYFCIRFRYNGERYEFAATKPLHFKPRGNGFILVDHIDIGNGSKLLDAGIYATKVKGGEIKEVMIVGATLDLSEQDALLDVNGKKLSGIIKLKKAEENELKVTFQ